MEENFIDKKRFFKSAGGALGLVLVSIIGIILLIFLGFFGYFLWAQKYAPLDTKEKLVEQFSPTFTKAPGLASSKTTATDKDIKTFIRPENPTFGKSNAPVTILAFIDFECPYSKKSFPIFEEMKQKYGSTIQVVFKHFPIDIIHPNARRASIAAQCAQSKNNFWPYYQSLFQKPNVSQDATLLSASEIGFNLENFSTCLNDSSISTMVTKDVEQGIELGVQGTPTYFVNQKKVEGVVDMATWDTIILEELQKKQ